MNEYWPQCPYSESQRISFDKVNPKRFASAAWERFERYKHAGTIGEYFEIVKNASVDKHFAKRDLQNDLSKGICKVQSEKATPAPQVNEASLAKPAGQKGSSTSSTPTPSTSSHADESKAGPEEDVKKAAIKDPIAPDLPVPAVRDASPSEVGAPQKNQEIPATAQPVSQDSVNGVTKTNKEKVPNSGESPPASNDQEEKTDTFDTKVPEKKLQSPEIPQATRLPEQSLFSLLGDQPKKPEPKKAARQDPKERKDAKASKEAKTKPEKSEAKSSKTSVDAAHPKRESSIRKKEKQTSKAAKVLQVREFVRDIVVDYIEGQPDPPERPQTTVDGKLPARMKDSKEPIAQQNRNGFIWVVDAGSAGYSHDSKSAQPLPPIVQNLRCGVCGKSCKLERLFRVRCYSRRVPGAVSELKDPRVMRQETYFAGITCLKMLLAPPFFPSSFIKQFRQRLLDALEAQGFDDHQWVEPLWRLEDAHGKAFTDVLLAELARVIRARGADEETEKEHNQKKLHEIDTFEDREHYRQLRLDRVVVTRCKQLKQRLSLSLMVNSQKSKEEHKKASGNAVVPEVLEDLLVIATHSALTLANLGLRPVAPGPKTNFGAASPVEGPPTKKAKVRATPEPPELLVSEPALPSQTWSTTAMTPNMLWGDGGIPTEMSAPEMLLRAGKQPQGETQIWDGTDHFQTTCYEFCGFRRRMLNCSYFVEQASYINGRRTFWNESKSVFMYWQSTSQRWAICQRWQHGQDLLREVQSGRDLGWAYFRSPGLWVEFADGVWHKINVTTVIQRRAPPPSLLDQLATGPPPRTPSATSVPRAPVPHQKVLPLGSHPVNLDGADRIETIGGDTPPAVMAMPVEPCAEAAEAADGDLLDICTPPA